MRCTRRNYRCGKALRIGDLVRVANALGSLGGDRKAAIIVQMGQFYSDEVGQFYIDANTPSDGTQLGSRGFRWADAVGYFLSNLDYCR